ncbi:sensor histidine kinase [Pseudonocardia sp. H11422]|uniref:sensor histidine kinase n=1 Tax=Pseudonocardia sp. H11422 TaxID=2835866 RepID=UPI0027E28C32|nr:ATP-binding protein [Pseudonocardia sp. H11422]
MKEVRDGRQGRGGRDDRDDTVGRRPLRPRSRRPDEARRWQLSRVFGVIAGVAGLLAIVAVVLATVVLVRLTDARSTLLDRVGPAVRAGQQLSAALVDQETGVRGFDMTRGEEFLDPYRDGITAEQRSVAVLRELDASGQIDGLGADVADVEAAAVAWRAGYAEPTIAALRSGAVTGPAEAERGRVLFDQVRAASTNLLDDLETERVTARERLEDAARFVTAVGIAIAVVIAIFLVAAGIALRRAVLAPISRLAAQVRGVVSGDVGRTVEGSGPREIAELGADVDAMRVHILGELSALQQINRRLDEQARELERSNRDLEQFAYVASHDLQEPLRKVSSFCQLLQRRYGGQLDEHADQYIEFAVDGAQRMQRLINDLLAFSRVGRTTAGFVPVELDAVARAAVASQERARIEADGEIVVGELPQVPGDAALLQQLFANLVGNALKFHREGVRPEVHVNAAPVDDGWEITVRDNGIGIEPEYADKVFVIFQRLHARDMYAGTGIGLALAKKIVEFHRGRIWVDIGPRDEPGTTIRLTLPTVPPAGSVTTGDPALAGGVAAEKETV